ncbi:MAG: N-acetylmuramoyl-L-alanine amidase [Clostridia bacterium]|nr:N-acetylmuramoyl-L-alanine amidase [Clostridia bacterium]
MNILKNKTTGDYSIFRIIVMIVSISVIIAMLTVAVMGMTGVIHFGKQNKQVKSICRYRDDKAVLSDVSSDSSVQSDANSVLPDEDIPDENMPKAVIVLDPGHGKPSGQMTNTDKQQNGWIYNSSMGGWGEWRHWKSDISWHDCEGSGCTGRAPANGGCWYPINHGDRDIEPELNMNNALAAKKYLEDLGYEVRMTRSADGNPSMTERLKFCYPDNDTSKNPDADYFVCIHSNAGGGKGTSYISLSGYYDQSPMAENYIQKSNILGKTINDKIVSDSPLTYYGSGCYDGYPELVLFCKSPIPIAYLEIGFYDNPSDLEILRSCSDTIGRSIAFGIDDYVDHQIELKEKELE